jgi:hypothetical protein
LPWEIREILLRGISKIDEFVVRMDQYNLKFVQDIKAFIQTHIFIDHMTFFGFSNALTKTFVFGEEEGDSQDPPTLIAERKT